MSRFSIFLLSLGLTVSCFSLLAGERDTYNFSWLDPDKEVYVLQNRKYRKKGKLHFNLGYGITTSGAFVDARAMQGRAGFFFLEEWGFEVIYSKNSGEENSTAASLRNEGASGSKPFRRIVNDYLGGMALWSPFYLKINTFNKIVYFDFLVGLGFGKIEEKNNRNEFLSSDPSFKGIDTIETHNALMWDVGIKFYLNQNWDIRMDLTTLHYKAKIASKTSTRETYYSNWDFALSLGYYF